MSSTKNRSRASITSSGRRLTDILLKNSFSMVNTRRSSFGSMATARTSSIPSEINILDEHDYENNRQIMRDLIKEIQIKKSMITFDETFLEQDNVIGCLLRTFLLYAEDVNGYKRISKDSMLQLLSKSELFNDDYTSTVFANDWYDLRTEMIKKKVYNRKVKTFDFCGFIQMIDKIKIRLNQSKDEIIKKILTPEIYTDINQIRQIRDKIHLGLLPSMNTLEKLYDDMQLNKTDERKFKKKRRKKKSKIKTKKSIQQNQSVVVQSEEEQSSTTNQSIQLKTLAKLQPWIKRDELDKDLMSKLFDLFQLASVQFQPGLIRENVFIQWLRAAQIIPDTYSSNLIEGVLSNVLARYINEKRYKLGTDTFEWNAFMECIRLLASEIDLPLNDIVRKLFIADEVSFRQWQTEIESIPEVGTHKKVNQFWDAKKVLAAVNLMREVVDDSRKLHLTDDERKRLRSLYKEFATFAYRRQSSHLEARLTNSVLSNWMRECHILDDKYTINELDKDFISILGDFTLNGLYPQGTRDVDFDGFLVLIQTIAAHKHIRADHLVQMIFAGPRSPLQKTSEFNEHMDRTKIQTSQGVQKN